MTESIKHLAATLSSPGLRPCGLCGQGRHATRAHVPPQVAGNTHRVRRAPEVIDHKRNRYTGRWNEGGLWVRGLCADCNHHAGRAYDQAYADFAKALHRLSTPTVRRFQVIPTDPPPVTFAPGLVSRSVLFGFFAIHPRLRVIFPGLAHDLMHEITHGQSPVRWPDQLSLKVGLTHPGLPRAALLASGTSSMRVLTERTLHSSFADIIFPPLAWSLVPNHTVEHPELGPEITSLMPDVSEWIRYGPDRTHVDLRNVLNARLPYFVPPLLASTNDWVELMTNDGTVNSSVIVHGQLPPDSELS